MMHNELMRRSAHLQIFEKHPATHAGQPFVLRELKCVVKMGELFFVMFVLQ